MRRRHVLTYVLLLGLTARASAQEVSRHQKSLVLSSATVIDGTGAAPRRDVTVIVQGDRIAAMGPSGAQPVPKGAEVVDARGLFLIPGLWDMHVHMAAESFLDLFVAAGVTTVRDIGAPPGMDLRSLSSRVEKGERLGPRMILSSPIIDGDPPLLPGVLVARSPADAVRIVDEQRHTGADFLKIYNMLSRETFFALAERARAVGIPFAGHVPLGVSAAEASDAKMASIEHLTGVLLGCSRREDALRRELLARVTAKGAAPYLVPRLLFWSDRGGFKWPVVGAYIETKSSQRLSPSSHCGSLHALPMAMRTSRVSLTIVTLTACVGGCTRPSVVRPPPKDSDVCRELDEFVRVDLARYQEPIDRAMAQAMVASWRLATGQGSSADEVARRWLEHSRLANDDRVLEHAAALERRLAGAESGCPEIGSRFRRARDLLHQWAKPSRVRPFEERVAEIEAALQQKTNAFRIRTDDQEITRNELHKRIAQEPDRARRERLFRLGASARPTFWREHGFPELLQARNALAQALGYADFDAYGFDWRGVDRARYFDLLARLKSRLAPRLRARLTEQARGEGVEAIRSWDLRYLLARAGRAELDRAVSHLEPAAMVDLARAFYRQLGLPLPEREITMDLTPRPGKNGFAATYIFRFPGGPTLADSSGGPALATDVAFLANLTRPAEWHDFELVVHELCHCQHALSIRQRIAYFHPYDPMATEALCMTVGRLVTQPVFLGSEPFRRAIGSERASELSREIERVERAERTKQVGELLMLLVATELERSFYADPAADPAVAFARIEREYFGIEVSPDEAAWDSEHFLGNGVYLQNYVLGILLAETFAAETRGVSLGALGPRILDYMRPGREFSFEQLAGRLLGHPLDERIATAALE